MSQPVVEQLTPNDEPAAVASLAAAFADYPLFRPLCPNAARRPQIIEAFCRYLFRMAVRCGGAFGTGDRAAVVCSWPPGAEWPGRFGAIRCGGLSLLWQLGWRGGRLLMQLEHGFDAARLKHVPTPHWYVSLMGVRPQMRGKSMSRVVLGPVFTAADRGRTPVYLETMDEANVAIYQKLGFELVGKSTLAGGLPNWELRRNTT